MKNINNYDNLEESWFRKFIQVFIKYKNQIIVRTWFYAFQGQWLLICLLYLCLNFSYSYFCYKTFAATITYNKRSSCQKVACLYVYKSQVLYSHSFNQVLIRRRLTLSTHVRIHEIFSIFKKYIRGLCEIFLNKI